MLSLDGERKSAPLIQTPSNEGEPALSPDGRWLAYSSDLSGRLEVYVQSFPDIGERWQISAEFGRGPKWAPSGQELFYRGPGGMMVAGIRTQPTFQPQAARILFEGDYLFSASSYDVAPDGQQFVMIKPSAAVTEAQVVLNWQEELKRRVPTK
jgi:hypothetical protein